MRAVGFWVVVLGLALGAWQASSGRAQTPKGSSEAVAFATIKNFEFIPATVTIAAGATVRWTNADVANHQITSGVVEGNQPRPDGRVSSPLLFRGDEFSITFRTPGEHPYYCGVHPFMRGTVGVK